MAKWIAAANARAGLRYAVVCPNVIVTGRTKERVAQSKRARVGSLAIVLSTSGANLYPPGIWFADVILSCSGVTFVLFRFRLCTFIEAAALRSIILRYAGAPTATRVSSFFPYVSLEMLSLFPSIFSTIITVLSLYGEYAVRFPPPDGVKKKSERSLTS